LDTLAPSFLQKTGEVATRLGMNPQDLLRIMSFETGGTFNPAEKNRAGSGATGLIQFTEQTAKNLGTTTEALAKMTPEEQLDYVEKYLTPYKGKLGSLKDAYLAVFKPAAIGQGLDTPLYTKDKDGLAYTQNAALDMGNKGRATVGDALGAVMRTTTGGAATGVSPAPDTSHLVAGTGAPAPTVSATDQAQLTRLNQQISAMDQFIAANVGSGRERTKSMVNEVQQMRSALVQEREKLMETSRAVEKQRALQPGVLEQQRVHGADAARIALEQKGEERIGPDVGRKLNLPAATKWKDVPADRKSIEDPSATERKGLTDLRAGVAGVDRLLTMLDKPEVQKMVGTLFTEPEATVNRVLGQWLSTLSPEQRKFGATLASEIMEIRHRLIGAGQTGIEVNALAPMMPSPGDTDVATLRAKLEALREGMLRRHDAQRDDLEGMGYRVPAKLARPAEASKPGPNVKKFEDALN
jgi:hypothetical protein